jgi:hypothetical protein
VKDEIHNNVAGLMHIIFYSLYLEDFDVNREAALSAKFIDLISFSRRVLGLCYNMNCIITDCCKIHQNPTNNKKCEKC